MPPKSALDLGNQLPIDGIAIRAQVGGIHRVAVVIVRIGVLYLDHEEAREVRTRPLPVERVRLLLLDPVVARQVKAVREIRFQVRIRRRRAEFGNVVRKMPVENHEGISRPGMCREPLWQQHMRAEIHIAPPELREQLAADADVPDVLGVFSGLDRGDSPLERERGPATKPWIEPDANRNRVQIARLALPMLTLSLVRWQQQRAPVPQVKGLVAIQHCLHQILAGRNLGQVARRPAERAIVEHHGLAGCQSLDIQSENERARQRLIR